MPKDDLDHTEVPRFHDALTHYPHAFVIDGEGTAEDPCRWRCHSCGRAFSREGVRVESYDVAQIETGTPKCLTNKVWL